MLDKATIRTEITTDPVAMVYGIWAVAADDLRICNLMNDSTKRPFKNVLVESWRVANTFDATEFAAISQATAGRLACLMSMPVIDLAATNIRTILGAIFPVGGPTRTSLVSLWASQIQNHSRAQEMNWSVTVEDVTFSRLNP